jgi:hypothetical protein
MTQTKQAKEIDLRYLINNYGIQLVLDDQFFREWQDDLPEITDLDKQLLDKVKASYFNLLNYPLLLESVVRIAIVDPILFIGDFCLTPFYIKAEEQIDITDEDEGVIIKGKLDTLVLRDQLWAMIIESKQAEYSIEKGLAQILAYMLGNPYPDRPSFGMITTGGSFIFIKLVKGEVIQYGTSKMFEIRNPGNELYDVLRILKHLTQIATAES